MIMRHLLLFLFCAFFATLVDAGCELKFSEGIGYIGPSCAVVEGNLYVHGIHVRPLNNTEIIQFELYQDGLAKMKKYQTSPPAEHKRIEMPAPMIPSFCGGMSDSTEVVLKGCVVRDSRVFIKGKLIRPLNSLEKNTINKLLTARSAVAHSPYAIFFQRKKRSTGEAAANVKSSTDSEAAVAFVEAKNDSVDAEGDSKNDESVDQAQNDVAAFLENFLRINATVARRFLPVAKMSPLFAEYAEHKASKQPETAAEEMHQREPRTVMNENYNVNSQPFQMPVFTYPEQEQPFQQQLPELTPLPSFTPSVGNEPEPYFEVNAFNQQQQHFPLPQAPQNSFQQQQNPEMTSAYILGGNDGQPMEVRGNIRPGDKIMVGGKSYVAVTMNQLNQNELSQLGNIFGNTQPGMGNGQRNTNYGSFVGTNQNQNQNQQQTWQPNSFMPFAQNNNQNSAFGQNFASQPKLRYHPGKSDQSTVLPFQQESSSTTTGSNVSPSALNAGMSVINQMPHQICTAHLANPFYFLEK